MPPSRDRDHIPGVCRFGGFAIASSAMANLRRFFSSAAASAIDFGAKRGTMRNASLADT